MSHELRTPLNAIIGFSEMIEMGVRGPVPPLAPRLAELHGGSLSIVSEKGRGTTVSVVLPGGGSETTFAEAAQ